MIPPLRQANRRLVVLIATVGVVTVFLVIGTTEKNIGQTSRHRGHGDVKETEGRHPRGTGTNSTAICREEVKDIKIIGGKKGNMTGHTGQTEHVLNEKNGGLLELAKKKANTGGKNEDLNTAVPKQGSKKMVMEKGRLDTQNMSSWRAYIKNVTNKFPLEGSRILKGKIGKFYRKNELAHSHRVVFMDLLVKFLQIAEQINLTYFIYGGSLIGSWRHHGFIPYDDDLDLIVKNSQKGALLKTIKKLNPDYVGIDGHPIIKFWSQNSTDRIKGTRHRWPFIDILFYEENATHIYDLLIPSLIFRKSDVFPLHKRPFEGVMVNAPRNSPKMIMMTYGAGAAEACIWRSYSHRFEKSVKKPSPVSYVRCKIFKGVYAFVDRRFLNGKMKETLMLGDKIIQNKIVDEPEENWTPIYSCKAGKL